MYEYIKSSQHYLCVNLLSDVYYQLLPKRTLLVELIPLSDECPNIFLPYIYLFWLIEMKLRQENWIDEFF